MIIFIPAPLVAVLTFPGVILHEMAHKFFCDYFNIKVFKVSYFRMTTHAGHVIHEPVYNTTKNAIIALAPLLINSVVCCILLSLYLILWELGSLFIWQVSPLDIFLIWVGLSCGLSALPSATDIKNVSKGTGIFSFIKIIVALLHLFGFAGEVLWLCLLWLLTTPIIRLICRLIV